ncbi:hypothetical protein [Paraburkholderia caledonica]|uniref:hypothetical protein n=1 Tax=Paraburkholderia caledonica TaxID=134536 RepID=UPI001180E0E1
MFDIADDESRSISRPISESVMLDGDAVHSGDVVWDVLLGAGHFDESFPDGGFLVRFGTRTIHYSAGDNFGGARRVYWFNPVIYLHRKSRCDAIGLIRDFIDALTRRGQA